MVGTLDANAEGPNGYPIIFSVIADRDLQAVRAFVEAGVDLEAKGFMLATPAIEAAQIDSWDICLYLLRQGANIAAATTSGHTIIYSAKNANVAADTDLGRDLAAVRSMIRSRGLEHLGLPPDKVRATIAEVGWPPRG